VRTFHPGSHLLDNVKKHFASIWMSGSKQSPTINNKVVLHCRARSSKHLGTQQINPGFSFPTDYTASRVEIRDANLAIGVFDIGVDMPHNGGASSKTALRIHLHFFFQSLTQQRG